MILRELALAASRSELAARTLLSQTKKQTSTVLGLWMRFQNDVGSTAQISVFKFIGKLAISISRIWSVHIRAATLLNSKLKSSCGFIAR